MKVYLGKYPNYYGIDKIVDYLEYVGVSEDRRDQISEYLHGTWVSRFLDWTYEKHKRKIKVRIDNYDIWSMDHTLALIIHPMLKKLKESKHGSPNVRNEDVPDHLRDTPEETEHYSKTCEVSSKFHLRWEYVIDEMIFAFEQILRDDLDLDYYYKKITLEEHKLIQNRIDNGTRLFGVYYRSLWD
jgi:hypothetical protein